MKQEGALTSSYGKAEDFTRTCHRTFHLMGKVKHLLLTGHCVGRHGLTARVCLIWRTFGLFVACYRRETYTPSFKLICLSDICFPMSVTMKFAIVWDVTSGSLVEVHRCFGGSYFFHFHVQSVMKPASRRSFPWVSQTQTFICMNTDTLQISTLKRVVTYICETPHGAKTQGEQSQHEQ
jgi:hypothetical protein